MGQFYCVCSVRAQGVGGESRWERSYMPVQTRSRSDKNAAVLGSKKPRQVPAFLYGLHRHITPLPAENRKKRRAPCVRFAKSGKSSLRRICAYEDCFAHANLHLPSPLLLTIDLRICGAFTSPLKRLRVTACTADHSRRSPLRSVGA